jgi:predicted phosphodiesterase
MRTAHLVGLAVCLVLVPGSRTFAQSELPPPNLKIAFLGDQSLGPWPIAVLELVRREGAHAVLHLGDFDYVDLPVLWEAQIDAVLGLDFPYFAVVGNHDEDEFYATLGYQHFMEARMERLGIPWEGDLGVASTFSYQGVRFVLTAPGVFGPGDGLYDRYVRDRLAEDDSVWRVSAWHKNQRLMQVGGKGDETGWGVYEESRKGGAIIATGHEHSYSRTHLLSSMSEQTVADRSDLLVLTSDVDATAADEGRSFAFVSGLGGSSIRGQEQSGDWWASIFTADQDARFGALFGVFHYAGNPRLAYFYFKDVSGRIVDEFFLWSTMGDAPTPPCSDGIDNDGDGMTDFDGGVSATDGSRIAPSDPDCVGLPYWPESSLACGSGFELGLLLPVVDLLRRRRRRRRTRDDQETDPSGVARTFDDS